MVAIIFVANLIQKKEAEEFYKNINENKAVFVEKKNVEFENSFKSFSPEETFSAQMTYDAKIKKYFWWK